MTDQINNRASEEHPVTWVQESSLLCDGRGAELATQMNNLNKLIQFGFRQERCQLKECKNLKVVTKNRS